MMKRKVAVLLALLMMVGLISNALADGFEVVPYDDTAATGYDTIGGGDTEHFIANGDFSLWDSGKPVSWKENVALKAGWDVHLAQMDYQNGNYALGMFFRSNGFSGPQYMSVSQPVSSGLTDGTYWVQVHVTAWEQGTTSPYNAVAWYGFGSSDDPSSVDTWHELFPDTYVCQNKFEICNHLGRAESMTIAAGSYMHIRSGMKFPDMNAWTVFGIDDVSINAMTEKSMDVTWWIDDGDVTWDRNGVR